MIAQLTGIISEISGNNLTLTLSGIGYEVHVPPTQLAKVKQGEELTLYIYEHIREDVHDLYGFIDLESKNLFQQLIGVSGVGPKVGLGIMAAASAENLRDAIASGQSEILQSVSGVGRKTAERIVVELKNKVVGDALRLKGVQSKDVALEALVQLGYSNHQAKEAVTRLPNDTKSDEERIRLALREVSKN